MCERRDDAYELYAEVKNTLKLDLDSWKITQELFDELNEKASNLIDECEDYRDYHKEIYDLLLSY